MGRSGKLPPWANDRNNPMEEELRCLVEGAKKLSLESKKLSRASRMRRKQVAELHREAAALHERLRYVWQVVRRDREPARSEPLSGEHDGGNPLDYRIL
jgi:hypothetical protein